MKINKEMMNTMTAEELEAAEKDLLECNVLLKKYDEEMFCSSDSVNFV